MIVTLINAVYLTIAIDRATSSITDSFFMFLYCLILLYFSSTATNVADLISKCYDKIFDVLNLMKHNLAVN